MIITGALATFRITKFILDDELPRELREKAEDALAIRQHHLLARKLDYLIHCPWCVSMYVATPLAILALKKPEIFQALALPLTFSAVTGLLYDAANPQPRLTIA